MESVSKEELDNQIMSLFLSCENLSQNDTGAF